LARPRSCVSGLAYISFGYKRSITRETGDTTETIKLTAHLANQEVEMLLVLAQLEKAPTDALGWPVGYFEAIDAIEADALRERPD
jgi:hypothetical protein